MKWRLIASGAQTEQQYDMFQIEVPDGAGMPERVLGTDEALYLLAGQVDVESNGIQSQAGAGSFAYMPAASVSRWRTTGGGARLLCCHFPGGFDRALAEGRGQDALVTAWLETSGTRFLQPSYLPCAQVGQKL